MVVLVLVLVVGAWRCVKFAVAEILALS